MVRTTRITVETESVAIVRKRTIAPGWCPNCGAEVDAVILDATLTSQIQDRHSTGKVHVWQEPCGLTRLCLSSLLQSIEAAEAQRGFRFAGVQFEQIREETMKLRISKTNLLGSQKRGNMKSKLFLVVLMTGLFAALASAQRMYVVSAGLTGSGVFGTVDLTTGAFQQIGPVEPDGYFGLAHESRGTLVSLTYAGDLVSINPQTGVPTQIGPTGLGACVTPSPSCGPTSAFSLGGFNGRIYATDYANSIYVVDPETGTAKLLAENSGIPPSPYVLGSQNQDGTLNFADEAIWESCGKFYATYDAWIFDPVTLSVADIVIPPVLYEINPRTGLANVIGPTALGIGGVVEVNGKNYAFDDLTGQTLELELTSGNTTPVDNFAAAAGVIQGAVPIRRPFFERAIHQE